MKGFSKLLSEELMEVVQTAEQSDAPVVRLWINNNLHVDALKEGSFDEEELILETARLLDDTQRFVFEPEFIKSLRDFYHVIKERQSLYLRFALSRQKNRIEALLKPIDFQDLEKRKQQLSRFIEKRMSELNQIKFEEKPENFTKVLSSHGVRLMARKLGPRLRAGAQFYEIIEIVNRMENEFKYIERDLKQRILNRKNTCLNALDDFNEQQRVIDYQLELRNKLNVVLQRTNAHLAVMVTDESIDNTDVSLAVPDIQDVLPSLIVNSDSSGKFTFNVKEIVAKRPSDPVLAVIPNGVKNGDKEKKPDSKLPEVLVNNDVVRLKEVIDVAHKTTNRIRVAMPNHLKSSLSKPWKRVFLMLGFRGKVEFCEYRVLANTSDFDSPIVIPKKMNTHTELWNKKNFACVVVTELSSPNLLKTIVVQANKKSK